MPKPAFGEYTGVEEGREYNAIISHVVSLGHQEYNGKKNHKYYVEFFIPEINQGRALSAFGINNWTSPSQPPFIGFFEVIKAVTKNETLTGKQASEYDFFQLAGKSVTLEFAQNEKGYLNVSKVSPCEEEVKADVELVTFGVEEIGTEKIETLPTKLQDLIAKSQEYLDAQFQKPTTVEDARDAGIPIESAQDADEVHPENVPF